MVALAVALVVAAGAALLGRQWVGGYRLTPPPVTYEHSPNVAVLQVDQSSGALPPQDVWKVQDTFYGDGRVTRTRVMGAQSPDRWERSRVDEIRLPPGKLDDLVRAVAASGLYDMTRGARPPGSGEAVISANLSIGKASVHSHVAPQYQAAYDRLLDDLLAAAGEPRGKPTFE